MRSWLPAEHHSPAPRYPHARRASARCRRRRLARAREYHLARGRGPQPRRATIPLRVGVPRSRADALRLAVVLVRVEPADQAPAVRVDLALEEVDRDRDAGGRLAGEVERDHLGAHPVLLRRPAFRLIPRLIRAGHSATRVATASGSPFGPVFHLDHAGPADSRAAAACRSSARGAVLVELERDDLRHLAGGRRARRVLAFFRLVAGVEVRVRLPIGDAFLYVLAAEREVRVVGEETLRACTWVRSLTGAKLAPPPER